MLTIFWHSPCYLGQSLTKPFCLNSALCDSQGWTSSNFVWILLSGTVKAESVRNFSSAPCSLVQLVLKQFEIFVWILLSGTDKAEPVRILSEFCSLGQSRLKQSELFFLNSALRQSRLNQFEPFRQHSALWDSWFWSSSNRFVWILLSGTVNSEAVGIVLSEFCSLGQSRLNQFEFCLNSALWDSQGWTSSNRFLRVLLYPSILILPCALMAH